MEKMLQTFYLRNDTISTAACNPLVQPIGMTVRTRGTRSTRLDRTAGLLFLDIESGQSMPIPRQFGARDTSVKNIKGRPYLVVFADLADQIGKSLVHINSLLSRCLNKATPEMLSKVTTLCVIEGVI
jgi:hypothetical protein